MSYEEVYTRSLQDPTGFWAEAATAIDWYKPFQQVLDNKTNAFLSLVCRG